MRKTIIIAALAALAVAEIASGTGYVLDGHDCQPSLTCGTGASLTTGSTAIAGIVNVGASATSCTLTWPTTCTTSEVFAWPFVPPCSVTFVDANGKGNIPIWIHSQSTSALVIDSASDMGDSQINYRCNTP